MAWRQVAQRRMECLGAKAKKNAYGEGNTQHSMKLPWTMICFSPRYVVAASTVGLAHSAKSFVHLWCAIRYSAVASVVSVVVTTILICGRNEHLLLSRRVILRSECTSRARLIFSPSIRWHVGVSALIPRWSQYVLLPHFLRCHFEHWIRADRRESHRCFAHRTISIQRPYDLVFIVFFPLLCEKAERRD